MTETGDAWGNFLRKVSPDPFKDFQNMYYVLFGALAYDHFGIGSPGIVYCGRDEP